MQNLARPDALLKDNIHRIFFCRFRDARDRDIARIIPPDHLLGLVDRFADIILCIIGLCRRLLRLFGDAGAGRYIKMNRISGPERRAGCCALLQNLSFGKGRILYQVNRHDKPLLLQRLPHLGQIAGIIIQQHDRLCIPPDGQDQL